MNINRDYYLDKLIRFQENKLVKIITGVRRAGKTYLLFSLFYSYLLNNGIDDEHIIKVKLDKIEYQELLNNFNLYKYIKEKIIDKKKYYILIDEVQLCKGFESVLSSFLDYPNVDIYVTGSNAKLLSKDIITEFRGRSHEIYLPPLSFKEFYTTCPNLSFQEAYLNYSTYGGLPILNTYDNKDKVDILTSILNETYLTDIIERHKIKNNKELDDLLSFVASNIGSLINPRKLANTLKSLNNSKISEMTISSYLSFFEDAFIISKATRYDIKGKKYLSTPYKYYFTDLGIRNAKLNFRSQDDAPHIMENIIYNELINHGFNVDVGVVEHFNKEKNTTKRNTFEIDFVCNLFDKKIYIQSAYSISDKEKLNQEKNSFKYSNDNFKKIIITNDLIYPHYNEEGIYFISLKDFLLNSETILDN